MARSVDFPAPFGPSKPTISPASHRNDTRLSAQRRPKLRETSAKLSEVKAELRRRMHDPIPAMGEWLRSVVNGHIRYYGVPMNQTALKIFWTQVGWLWHRALSRLSVRRLNANMGQSAQIEREP